MDGVKKSVRDRIMETASSLFHAQGYNSTGINQIIAEAAVSKASFYHHFKSKESLCVAYLQQRHTYWFSALESFISNGPDNRTKVILAFEFLKKLNEEEHFNGCSFFNIISEIGHEQQEILKEAQQHKHDLLLFFKDLLPTEKAIHIHLLFEAAFIESQLFKKQWPVDEAIKLLNNII